MKKTVSVLLTIVCIFLVAVQSGFAETRTNRVFAKSITIQTGERITVPIQIENNSGFMGFSITVTYNPNVFAPVAVQRGAMLSGMFNDSVGVSSSGSFRVVYSGAENCTQDGTLFSVTLDIAQTAQSGDYTLQLTYSAQDTFDETWKDVVLSCEDITVKICDTEPVTETETEPVTEPETEPITELTTEPVSQPSEKTLSQRMIDWLNRMPVVFKYMLWIFVRPLAALISLFE